MRSYFDVAIFLGLATVARAQLSSVCPESDICFGLNIPESTASSGDGDIFIQLSAPLSYSWVALGQGNSMSGSHIFLMYTDSQGDNVTVSPRLSSGYSEPQFTEDTEIAILEGSTVSGNSMIANVKCSNCQSWSGGSMDFTGSSNSWIYAYKGGSSLDSDDQSESISIHDSFGLLSFDFADATGGDSVNPLADATISSDSTSSCVPRSQSPTASSSSSTGGSSGSDSSYGQGFGSGGGDGRGWWGESSDWNKRDDDINYCDDDSSGESSNSNSNGLFSTGFSSSKNRDLIIAHGVMAGLAFAVLFPLGGIVIRLLNFSGLVWCHAALQIIAYLVYIVAFGMGVYLAQQRSQLKENHPVIGIVVFILLFGQTIFGFIHHEQFKKYHSRTFWSHGHLWLGRGIITLGIINGGLGLLLANNTSWGAILYGVVAGVFWLAYVAAAIFGEIKRPRNDPPKYSPRNEVAAEEASQTREFYGKTSNT